MSKKSDYKLRTSPYLEELSREEGIVKLPKGILCRVLQSGPAVVVSPMCAALYVSTIQGALSMAACSMIRVEMVYLQPFV